MAFLLILFFILGSAVGSFLNVVIDRTMRRESILGRSYCDWCHRQLSPLDLVPIFSFLVLGGKCRRCHRKLSIQYPTVEGMTGVLFSLAFLSLSQKGIFSPSAFIFEIILISALVVVAVVDFKFSLIPTAYLFALSLLTLFYNFFYLPSEVFVQSVLAAFGAAVFFGVIIILTRGRGMGEGDVPLAFLIGLVLGPINGLLGLFMAFLTGAIVSVVLIVFGKKRFGQTIPFAPFLIFGFLLSLFWAEPIMRWYLSFY